jgi:hypothetical protein
MKHNQKLWMWLVVLGILLDAIEVYLIFKGED